MTNQGLAMDPAHDDQSDEVSITVVVDEQGGTVWQACGGGHCVRSHSGVRVLELLAALLRSKGLPVPPLS